MRVRAGGRAAQAFIKTTRSIPDQLYRAEMERFHRGGNGQCQRKNKTPVSSNRLFPHFLPSPCSHTPPPALALAQLVEFDTSTPIRRLPSQCSAAGTASACPARAARRAHPRAVYLVLRLKRAERGKRKRSSRGEGLTLLQIKEWCAGVRERERSECRGNRGLPCSRVTSRF